MSLALVEADLRTVLRVGVENPFYYRESALDTPDPAQRSRQIVLAWARREFV